MAATLRHGSNATRCRSARTGRCCQGTSLGGPSTGGGSGRGTQHRRRTGCRRGGRAAAARQHDARARRRSIPATGKAEIRIDQLAGRATSTTASTRPRRTPRTAWLRDHGFQYTDAHIQDQPRLPRRHRHRPREPVAHLRCTSGARAPALQRAGERREHHRRVQPGRPAEDVARDDDDAAAVGAAEEDLRFHERRRSRPGCADATRLDTSAGSRAAPRRTASARATSTLSAGVRRRVGARHAAPELEHVRRRPPDPCGCRWSSWRAPRRARRPRCPQVIELLVAATRRQAGSDRRGDHAPTSRCASSGSEPGSPAPLSVHDRTARTARRHPTTHPPPPPGAPPCRSAQLTNYAVGYSKAMDAISAQAQDPTLVQDPARLAIFQQQMYYAQTGYTMTARAIQDMHARTRSSREMLRDA